MRPVWCIAAALTCCVGVCGAADSPDWQPVGTDPPYARELTPEAAATRVAPDVIGLEVAHFGGARLLWRVSFSRPFVTDGTVLILYLDVDGDESTGRSGLSVQGTDRMLTLIDGESGSSVYSSAGSGRRTSARVDGNSVVFSDDLGLLARRIRDARSASSADGAAGAETAGSDNTGVAPYEFRCRARVLCHRAADSADADDTMWFSAAVSIDPFRPAPRVDVGDASVVRDLRAWWDGFTLQVRFTTTEAVFASVFGDGLTAAPQDSRMLRNHSWSLTGHGDAFTIVIGDDLLEQVETLEMCVPQSRKGSAVDGSTETRSLELYLNVDEDAIAAWPHRAAAVRWPVAGSVPFPPGTLTSPHRVRLLDGAGNERLVQAETVSRWPDGSVRWLMLDFIADLPGDLRAGFRLEYGPGVSRSQAPGHKFPDIDPQTMWAETARWEGGAGPRLVTRSSVETDGPVRRVYLTEGVYGDESGDSTFGCITRVYAYAGLPFVRIEHTTAVLGGDPIARLGALRLVFYDAAGGTMSDQDAARWKPSDDAQLLEQVTIDEARTGTVGRPTFFSGRLNGVAQVDRTGSQAAVIVRDFAENWPKAMLTDGGVIAVDLFPELSPGTYADRAEPEERLYYCFDQGYYKIRRGVRKTHEMLYVPERGGSDAQVLAFWFANPPAVRATPEWVCASGAAGHLTPVSPGEFDHYEAHVRASFDAVEQARVKNREYGFLNFGDWYGERGRNWGNLEYDLAHGLWLQWLRSNDYRYLRRAEQAAAHMADVDIIHSDRDPMNIGRVWTHALGHTGGYYPDGAFGMDNWCARGYLDNGHIWNEGLLHVYLATGSRRLMDAGMLVANHLARFATAEFRMGPERTAGWPIIALTAAYEFTADPYYLNGAKLIAMVAMDRQDPETGGWLHRIGECKHDPAHYGGKPFMTGVLTTALARLHHALPQSDQEDRDLREQVKRSLLRACDWLLDVAWQDDVSGFFYAQCPDFYGKPCAASPWMTCEALGYASEISGDPRYTAIAKRALDKVIAAGRKGLGKSLAMDIRSTPHFIALLAKKREPAPPTR